MRLIKLSSSSPDVLLEAALEHARIDGGTREQDTISALLAAALDFIEREARIACLTSRFALYCDGWPADRQLTLPRPPFVEVDCVLYRSGGKDHILPATSYAADPEGSRPGRVVFTGDLPAVDAVPGAVCIEFTCGSPADALPPTLRTAILMLFSYWFTHREAAHDRRIDALPLALQSIITQHSWLEVL